VIAVFGLRIDGRKTKPATIAFAGRIPRNSDKLLDENCVQAVNDRAVRRKYQMRCVRYLALLAAAVLTLPVAMLAQDAYQHNVLISDSVLVNGVHLNPGTYKLEWNQAGPQVQVTFVRHGKQVATVPATLKKNDKQITQDDFQTSESSSNQEILNEIDFGRQNEALVFSNHT
jgi:hypothetical protein